MKLLVLISTTLVAVSCTQEECYTKARGRLASTSCVFPFSYLGELYYSCTTKDSTNGEAWCGTTETVRLTAAGKVVESDVGDCDFQTSLGCDVDPESGGWCETAQDCYSHGRACDPSPAESNGCSCKNNVCKLSSLDLCSQSPCGLNAKCHETRGRAVCKCLPGFGGDPFHECKPPALDPCSPTPCGLNAKCHETRGRAVCKCLPGFEGDPFHECKPPALDPCSLTPCGLNANCYETRGRAVCKCLPGFEGDPFLECKPPALPIIKATCTLHQECADNLACIASKCLDPCPGLCGVRATCFVNNHIPNCKCEPGYTGNPFLTCYPKHECTINQDCASNSVCIQNKCLDPCPGLCGDHTTCAVENHSAICTCEPGYTGDPFVSCSRVDERQGLPGGLAGGLPGGLSRGKPGVPPPPGGRPALAPGGIFDIDVNDANETVAAVVATLSGITGANNPVSTCGKKIKLVSVEKAQAQIVQGKNFYFTLRLATHNEDDCTTQVEKVCSGINVWRKFRHECPEYKPCHQLLGQENIKCKDAEPTLGKKEGERCGPCECLSGSYGDCEDGLICERNTPQHRRIADLPGVCTRPVPPPPAPGSLFDIDVNDDEAKEAAAVAVATLSRITEANNQHSSEGTGFINPVSTCGKNIKLIGVEKAQAQIVQGKNFYFTLRLATHNDDDCTTQVEKVCSGINIWRKLNHQLWGHELFGQENIKCKDAEPTLVPPPPGGRPALAPGGQFDIDVNNPEAKEAVAAAVATLSGITGANNPVSTCGKNIRLVAVKNAQAQIVQGKNFYFVLRLATHKDGDCTTEVEKVCMGIAVWRKLRHECPGNKPCHQLLGIREPDQENIECKEDFVPTQEEIKQEGESCGSCFCPPTYSAGVCSEGLICERDERLPDAPGICRRPVPPPPGGRPALAPGGLFDIDVNNPEAKEAVAAAVATLSGGTGFINPVSTCGKKIKLVGVEKAQAQIVQGKNFYFTLRLATHKEDDCTTQVEKLCSGINIWRKLRHDCPGLEPCHQLLGQENIECKDAEPTNGGLPRSFPGGLSRGKPGGIFDIEVNDDEATEAVAAAVATLSGITGANNPVSTCGKNIGLVSVEKAQAQIIQGKNFYFTLRLATHKDDDCTTQVEKVCMGIAVWRKLRHDCPGNKPCHQLLGIREPDQENIECKEDFKPIQEARKKEGEKCGPCECLPPITSLGECEDGLTCVRNPRISDAPGVCTRL